MLSAQSSIHWVSNSITLLTGFAVSEGTWPPLQAQQQEAGYADRAKESIRTNAKWVERHSKDVCAWVQQRLQRR